MNLLAVYSSKGLIVSTLKELTLFLRHSYAQFLIINRRSTSTHPLAAELDPCPRFTWLLHVLLCFCDFAVLCNPSSILCMLLEDYQSEPFHFCHYCDLRNGAYYVCHNNTYVIPDKLIYRVYLILVGHFRLQSSFAAVPEQLWLLVRHRWCRIYHQSIWSCYFKHVGTNLPLSICISPQCLISRYVPRDLSHTSLLIPTPSRRPASATLN